MPATMVFFSDFNLVHKKRCNFDIEILPDFKISQTNSAKLGHILKITSNITEKDACIASNLTLEIKT
jgi:hypothetical protein